MSQLRLPSFDQKVYALSKIVHRVKFQNNRSDHYTTTQRKHLRLLDDIALLLVTQSASDVAAVAFEQRQGTVVFYYAKNRLATTEELDYISRLTDLAQDIGETDRIELMFNAVLTVCLPKIMSRFDKLLSVLTKIPAAARAGTDDPDHELGFHLEAELGVWYNAQEGPAALVDNFLQHLRQLVASESQHAQGLQALGQIIRVAHATGSFKRRSMVNGQEKAEYTVYPDESLAKRMRLLGDYWGAVKRIVRHANSILTRRTVKFQMQQIATQVPIQSRMPTDYLSIVNGHAIHRKIGTISYKALKNAYPDATALSPADVHKTQRVTHSAHAECTVAMYMAALSRPWEYVEIGCSKSSCWLCERYLSFDTRLKFHVSNVHGKLQPGWTIPYNGEVHVNAQVVEMIEDELEEVILRVVGSKTGDSEPRSPSDCDDEALGCSTDNATPRTGGLYWETKRRDA